MRKGRLTDSGVLASPGLQNTGNGQMSRLKSTMGCCKGICYPKGRHKGVIEATPRWGPQPSLLAPIASHVVASLLKTSKKQGKAAQALRSEGVFATRYVAGLLA